VKQGDKTMAVYMLASGDRRHALACFLGERVEGPESIGAQAPVEYDDLSAREKLALARFSRSTPRYTGREPDYGDVVQGAL